MRNRAIAHTQGVNEPPAAIQQVSNATADAANPYATCAGSTRPADGSQIPPDQLEPLWVVASDEDERETADETSYVETSEDETTTTTTPPSAPQSASLEGESAPQASDGSVELTVHKPDEAKATRDQGYRPTISASTWSASRNHPTDMETTTDPARPSEDPADATGDDERPPDAPTEPPDKPDGMGRREGEQSVEEVEAEVSRASVEGTEAAGDDGDEERRPGKPDEPPDTPQVKSTEPADTQVEPGGETDTERNRSVAHESADAGVDGEVVGTSRDVQNEAETSRTRRGDPIEGERPSALARGQSTMKADEDDQRNEAIIDDLPIGPPDPPPPPDEPANRQNEPPSVELEGEREESASSEDARTSNKADVSGASIRDEDTRTRPKNLWNASGNGWSEGEKKTHLGGLQTNHMTQEAKRPYQVVSTTSRNILGSSVVSAPMKRTHHVEIPAQEVA